MGRLQGKLNKQEEKQPVNCNNSKGNIIHLRRNNQNHVKALGQQSEPHKRTSMSLYVRLSYCCGHKGQKTRRTNRFVQHHCKSTKNEHTAHLSPAPHKIRDSSTLRTLAAVHQERQLVKPEVSHLNGLCDGQGMLRRPERPRPGGPGDKAGCQLCHQILK